MRATRTVSVALILLALVMAIAAPVVLAGLRSLRLARSADTSGRQAEAAGYYELAAREWPWRTDLWERAGLSAYNAGDYSATVRLLQLPKQTRVLSARGWDVLGSAYWATQDRVSAILAWQSGAGAYPREAPLLDHLANAYDQVADYAAERDVLERRLALGDEPAAHYRLGLLLMGPDTARAKRELEAAAADADFGPAAATLLASLQATAEAAGPADRLVIIGRALGLVNEWALASGVFTQAVAQDATNAEAWAWLGEARQHAGQDGLRELDRALALNAEDALVHALRGLHWQRNGRYAPAVSEYLRAAEIQPNNPALQAALAEAYAAAGDLVASLAAYQKATKLAPSDASYWRRLAAFCADNGVQPLEIGLPAAEKAAALLPHDAEVLDVLGWSYARAGYPEKAEQTLLDAVRLAPRLASAHVHLAVVYLQRGMQALALDQLKIARDLDPDGPAGQSAAALVAQYFP